MVIPSRFTKNKLVAPFKDRPLFKRPFVFHTWPWLRVGLPGMADLSLYVSLMGGEMGRSGQMKIGGVSTI